MQVIEVFRSTVEERWNISSTGGRSEVVVVGVAGMAGRARSRVFGGGELFAWGNPCRDPQIIAIWTLDDKYGVRSS
jgi:hypothetical protein